MAQLTIGLRNYSRTGSDDWRHLLDQARAAEDAGVDRVFVSDHLVFGSSLDDYGDPERGGRVGGVQPTGPDGEWLEALTVVSAMLAVTDRVLVGTNVLVAPLRPPVLLAKMAATLDVMSHGRFELGVGIGWQRAEYEALGLDFRRRGALFDEQLAACRELWTAPVARFEGRFVQFEDVHMMPKPVRAEGVPLWIGGSARPVVARRIARYGSGWIPWGTEPDRFLDAVAQMRELVAAEGGDPAGIQIAYALPNRFTDDGRVDGAALFADVPRLLEAGITDFRTLLRVPHDYEGARAMLQDLVTAFDRATGRDRAIDCTSNQLVG
ncbi:TIGR03619 family F420-dependent LLM class oxidoreductase [Microbacterium sp.]|uniref:TIGR03619 family F420-dependent LLM class oxidoreductase n=1 Tax=Microbacterium sp. TaxID=51671 RepID=UPI0037C88AC0